MSYRLEKNQNGTTNDIVISGWEKGIANSAVLGHENIINMDIWTRPGFAQPGFTWGPASLNGTPSGNFGVVNWIRYNPIDGLLYALGNTGTVFRDTTGQGAVWNTLAGSSPTGAHGNGLAVWISRTNAGHSFVFVARDTELDVYDVANATWHLNFQALNPTAKHPMYVATDGRLYVGNHAGVLSFQEVDGVLFDPTNTATYTINDPALDLPGGYFVSALTQLGQNLMIGTTVSTGASGTGVANIADIFPWDRVSDSYEFPISLQTNGVNQMSVLNNLAYIQAGFVSNVSATNGSTTQIVIQDLPLQGLGYPGGIDVIDGRTLAFGVIGVGVYGSRDGKYVTLNSHVVNGTPDNILLNAVCATPINQNSFVYGVDNTIVQVDGASRFGDYSASIATDIIPVSTFYFKRAFSEIEFRLGSILPVGGGVKISYRTSLDAAWIPIGGWENNVTPSAGTINVGTVMSFADAANIDQSEYLQFLIQLKNGNTNTDTVYLREIRVR